MGPDKPSNGGSPGSRRADHGSAVPGPCVPGHGQGLGIIKDIAELYGGSLKLMRSRYGGLLAELSLPAA